MITRVSRDPAPTSDRAQVTVSDPGRLTTRVRRSGAPGGASASPILNVHKRSSWRAGSRTSRAGTPELPCSARSPRPWSGPCGHRAGTGRRARKRSRTPPRPTGRRSTRRPRVQARSLGQAGGTIGGHIEADERRQFRLIRDADARDLRDRQRDAFQLRAHPEALADQRSASAFGMTGSLPGGRTRHNQRPPAVQRTRDDHMTSRTYRCTKTKPCAASCGALTSAGATQTVARARKAGVAGRDAGGIQDRDRALPRAPYHPRRLAAAAGYAEVATGSADGRRPAATADPAVCPGGLGLHPFLGKTGRRGQSGPRRRQAAALRRPPLPV
jgi:hypothetical protein